MAPSDYVSMKEVEFTINDDKRMVLFQHPNSEVVFKDVPINENAKLEFGIGIDQTAWDKSGDGVLFKIRIVDEKSQNILLFSQYINPKNTVEDRKWFDEDIDLRAFAGQKVSFIFKTTAGPQNDIRYDWAGWSRPQITLRGVKESVVPRDIAHEVIHPYLGFVLNPEFNNEGGTKSRNKTPISEYGFVDETGPIHPKSNGKVIIGIFGGSFAKAFSSEGIDSLTKELRKSSIFSDKEIVVVRAALGGYKQPQQLMALTYLLALGAHFDLIINIDGFNEVVIPPLENIPKNVNPFFPRNWFMKVQALPDPVTQSIVGEITYLRSKRGKWAGVFSKAPIRYSVTMNLIWKYYDSHLAKAISRAQLTLQSYKPTKVGGYVMTGPSYHFKSEADLFQDLASIWKNSSLQMHKLSTANNIRYFHFLQPNQYIPGSKIMGEEELKQAFLEGHPYKKGVERGYPYLVKAGQELVNEGVNFHDLSMVFANKVEPLYIDTCCH